MKALLLAAGLGTRLRPLTDHQPKALVQVNNHTLLERNLIYLRKFGVNDVIINVHHFASMIEGAVEQNNGYGSNVTISDERNEVLETGGGLKKALSFFAGEETNSVPQNLLTNRLVFLHTDLTHNEVIFRRDEFAEFLKTSCLENK